MLHESGAASTLQISGNASSYAARTIGQGRIIDRTMNFSPRETSLKGENFHNAFFKGKEDDNAANWLRQFDSVGMRVGEFPQFIGLEGRECATAQFQPEIDADQVSFHTYGASHHREFEGVLSSSSDPADGPPSIIEELHFESEIQHFNALVEAPHILELHLSLLYDENKDGIFDSSTETIVDNKSPYRKHLQITPGPLPAGDYAIQIIGFDLFEDQASYELKLEVGTGNEFYVDDAPTEFRSGETHTVRVCGRPTRVHPPSLDTEYGVLSIDFGHAPRRIDIPILWRSGRAGLQPNAVFLPLLRVESDD